MEALPIIVPFFGALLIYTSVGLCCIRRSYQQQYQYLGERIHALELKMREKAVRPVSEPNLDPMPVQNTVFPIQAPQVPVYTTPIYPQYNTGMMYPQPQYMPSQNYVQ